MIAATPAPARAPRLAAFAVSGGAPGRPRGGSSPPGGRSPGPSSTSASSARASCAAWCGAWSGRCWRSARPAPAGGPGRPARRRAGAQAVRPRSRAALARARGLRCRTARGRERRGRCGRLRRHVRPRLARPSPAPPKPSCWRASTRPPARPRRRHHGRQRALGAAAQAARVEGHRAGVDAVRDLVEAAARLGLRHLTLYAFSVENWKRPRAEVWTLMNCCASTCGGSSTRWCATTSVSSRSALARARPSVVAALERAATATAGCGGMRFNIALNYSGRCEIVDACRRIVADWAAGRPVDIDEATLSASLYTSGQPDPDCSSALGRDAGVELPALADRLRRDLGDARAVAGLPPSSSLRGDPRVPVRERRFGGVEAVDLSPPAARRGRGLTQPERSGEEAPDRQPSSFPSRCSPSSACPAGRSSCSARR